VKEFHGEVGKELGEQFDAIPGQFRTDDRVAGPYKCPAPTHIEDLMGRLCGWLQEEFGFASNKQTFADAVVQAIVTHVYLEWIHPFGDGNGRTGRLLEFYVLLRAGNPDIASHILSTFYNQTRPEYYRQLDQAGKTRDLSAFIRYAIQGYRDGLRAVMVAVADNNLKVSWKYLVHSKFAETPYRKKSVFKRRRNLALAIPPDKELDLDQIMILTPELAREYAVRTERTLLRDLEELHKIEIVTAENGRYRLNLGLLVDHMARRRMKANAAA
jgi:Fic family protein